MKVIGYVGDVIEGMVGVLWTGLKYMILGSLLGAVIITAVLWSVFYTM